MSKLLILLSSLIYVFLSCSATNCIFNLTSSAPARRFIWGLLSYLSTCKWVLCISFLSIFTFSDISRNLQDEYLCFLSLHIFLLFLRCRLQDGRYHHLTDMLLLYLPRTYHLFTVLHSAFCGFIHDTSGWFSIYFNGAKRCTDDANNIYLKCILLLGQRIRS